MILHDTDHVIKIGKMCLSMQLMVKWMKWDKAFKPPHFALVYKSRPTAPTSQIRVQPLLLKTFPDYLNHHCFL